MVSRHLEHLPLREVVAGEIRAMIVSGELAPGERLVEGQLAAELGVSRNPVREAIRLLEGTGLVEVLPRKGAYVCAVDNRQVRQIQELRIVVEGYAAELAAEHHTADDIAALTDCTTRGREATEADDHVTAAAYHREFHLALERAAGNPYLELVVNPLRQQTELVFSVVLEERGGIGWEEHEAITEAIRQRDPVAARTRMRDHIENALVAFETSEAAPRTTPRSDAAG